MHLPPREGAVHGYERVERGTDEVGVPQMRIGAGDFVADGGVVAWGDEREVVD